MGKAREYLRVSEKRIGNSGIGDRFLTGAAAWGEPQPASVSSPCLNHPIFGLAGRRRDCGGKGSLTLHSARVVQPQLRDAFRGFQEGQNRKNSYDYPVMSRSGLAGSVQETA